MRTAIERFTRRLADGADRFATRGDRLVRGPGVRRAWLVVGCLATVPILGLGLVQAASTLAHEEHAEVATFDAADLSGVVVDNGAGSVSVVGVEDARSVTVHARISEGLRATGHEISARDGQLRVDGSCPLFGSEWCGVDYTIEVPEDLRVAVDARGGVSVSDTSGGVVARSRSHVELVRVGGEVEASADQGRLEGRDLSAGRVVADADQGRVVLEFATSPDAIDVEADQGTVDIVLTYEEDVFYAPPETEADQGTVSDRINQDPRSDRTIAVKADQGNITIRYAP